MQIRVTLTDGSEGVAYVEYKLRDISIFYADLNDLILEQYDSGIIEYYDYTAPTELPWWVSFLPYLTRNRPFIVMWVYMINQASGGRGSKLSSFGRSRAKMVDTSKKSHLPRCRRSGRRKRRAA